MTPQKAKLQSWALRARAIPGVPALYRAWYKIGTRAFLHFTRGADKKFGVVRAVYLRRGGGREELIPGASDLDFFLLLNTVSAEREMEFLKEFWERYHRWRVPFPFLGEVLMGDENELVNWFESPTVRSYEASFSWKLLAGESPLRLATAPAEPDTRDAFSEALKNYWSLLQPVLKLRPEHFRAGIQAHESAAVHLRNSAKAALDLFRLHYAQALPASERLKVWKASRKELLQLLPPARYGEGLARLAPVLELRDPLFPADPFPLYAGLIQTACSCLHDMAEALAKRSEETESWKVVYHSKEAAADTYSLSVRELFAERLLLRHQEVLGRAVLSAMTAHMYFPLKRLPSKQEMAEILADLRDVSFSFDRFSVAMPITETTFRELERTSLLDTPFHSFYAHQEIRFQPDGQLVTGRYPSPEPKLPVSMLQKTFAELSFSLRFQPQELEFLLEKMVALVLSLRLAAEHGVVATDFDASLAEFSRKFPHRADHLKAQLAPYLPARSETEQALWQQLFAVLDAYKDYVRADSLRSQLEALRGRNLELPKSDTLATDLWINLTPFLRMEMNAMKDRYFRHKPVLKI